MPVSLEFQSFLHQEPNQVIVTLLTKNHQMKKESFQTPILKNQNHLFVLVLNHHLQIYLKILLAEQTYNLHQKDKNQNQL